MDAFFYCGNVTLTLKKYQLYFSPQKLNREAIQMRLDHEELVEFTEEKFLDKTSEQGKSAWDEVEDLRQRLDVLVAELDTKKSGVETVQKLQAKFQEQCRHLNAVLQDAESKLINGEDVERLHEQEQSLEVNIQF